MIREKAQLARAASYAVAEDELGSLSGGEAESADLIGRGSTPRSHDSSLSSSTGLTNILSTDDSYTMVSSSNSEYSPEKSALHKRTMYIPEKSARKHFCCMAIIFCPLCVFT